MTCYRRMAVVCPKPTLALQIAMTAVASLLPVSFDFMDASIRPEAEITAWNTGPVRRCAT